MSKEAEKILNALITETRKNVIDFMEVTPERLDMDESAFYNAMKELERIGKVSGVIWGDNKTCLYDNISINA